MEEYLRKAIDGFQRDPPDTPYQRGYLAALVSVAEEMDLRHLAVLGCDILAEAAAAPRATGDDT